MNTFKLTTTMYCLAQGKMPPQLWSQRRLVFDEPKGVETTTSAPPEQPNKDELLPKFSAARNKLSNVTDSLEKKVDTLQNFLIHEDAKELKEARAILTQSYTLLSGSQYTPTEDAQIIQQTTDNFEQKAAQFQKIQEALDQFAYREARRNLINSYETAGVFGKNEIERMFEKASVQYGENLPKDDMNPYGMTPRLQGMSHSDKDGGMDARIGVLKAIQDVHNTTDGTGKLDDTKAQKTLDTIGNNGSNPLRISALKAQKRIDLTVEKAIQDVQTTYPDTNSSSALETSIKDMINMANEIGNGEGKFKKIILSGIIDDYAYEIDHTVITQQAKGRDLKGLDAEEKEIEGKASAKEYIQSEANNVDRQIYNKKSYAINTLKAEYITNIEKSRNPKERQRLLLEYKLRLDMLMDKYGTARGYIRAEVKAAIAKNPAKRDKYMQKGNECLNELETKPPNDGKDLTARLAEFKAGLSTL